MRDHSFRPCTEPDDTPPVCVCAAALVFDAGRQALVCQGCLRNPDACICERSA
jgi:hypothetical protein